MLGMIFLGEIGAPLSDRVYDTPIHAILAWIEALPSEKESTKFQQPCSEDGSLRFVLSKIVPAWDFR